MLHLIDATSHLSEAVASGSESVHERLHNSGQKVLLEHWNS